MHDVKGKATTWRSLSQLPTAKFMAQSFIRMVKLTGENNDKRRTVVRKKKKPPPKKHALFLYFISYNTRVEYKHSRQVKVCPFIYYMKRKDNPIKVHEMGSRRTHIGS